MYYRHKPTAIEHAEIRLMQLTFRNTDTIQLNLLQAIQNPFVRAIVESPKYSHNTSCEVIFAGLNYLKEKGV